MAVYIYKCKKCDAREETIKSIKDGPGVAPVCGAHGEMIRDWKNERPQTLIPLHMSAKNTSSKNDFIPTEKFFEAPNDPDGTKGMKEWKDNHKPIDSRWV